MHLNEEQKKARLRLRSISTPGQLHHFKDKSKSGTEKTDHSNAVTQNCAGLNWTAETAALMPVAGLRLVTNITVPIAGKSNLLVKHSCTATVFCLVYYSLSNASN